MLVLFMCIKYHGTGGRHNPYMISTTAHDTVTHLLSAKCYIYTSKLRLFFASNIIFCRSQVTNMEMHDKKV